MIFRQLLDKESSTYTYLFADEKTREAVLIDPVLDQITLYLQLLEELGLTLKVAMDTHTHADHITALGKLREKTACRTLMGEQAKSDCASGSFSDMQEIKVGSLVFTALYTPGHTDDSYSFSLKHEDQRYLFTGDTLLIRGTGRTDFQNGDAELQYQSLSRLLSLPDSTWVYPAHDYKGWTVSTIAEEKRHNPRLDVANASEYKNIMDNLNLPDPKMMDVAVPANRSCGESRPD
ncbi:MBL fold metallo-hydrolase [Methylophaga sp.]|uniref:MBL fold metallo-hydrolase n=1 Tax=Methylophaga sp. TaxID=2024840 RepID=UPI003F69C3D0